jgi:hypothetical protein
MKMRRTLLVLVLLVALLGTSRTGRTQTASTAPPTVVFMTDFGVVDDSVALCKGVMYSIAP